MPACDYLNGLSLNLLTGEMETLGNQALDPNPSKLGQCTYTYTHLTGCGVNKPCLVTASMSKPCGLTAINPANPKTCKYQSNCHDTRTPTDLNGLKMSLWDIESQHGQIKSNSNGTHYQNGSVKAIINNSDTASNFVKDSYKDSCYITESRDLCASCENIANNNRTLTSKSICSTGRDTHSCHACAGHNGPHTACHKQTMPFGAVNAKQAANALGQLLVTLMLKNCGASTVAIDNKIEQAMDLVKSHLMFAVREEVLVLKEQIKELLEKNSQLEYENSILRAAATQETLTKLSQTNPGPTQSSTS